MNRKPTYEELFERIRELEQEAFERKQAENSLKESAVTLRSIFRAAPTGIGMVCDRVIKQANERLCEILGYSREELLRRSARMLYLTDEDFEYVGREKYEQIHERGIGVVETRLRRKDGKVIDVLLSSAPLDPNDLSIGVTFTVLDITSRKQAEEALQESEKKYRLLVESTPDWVWICDEESRITFSNKAIKKLLGYEVHEILGRSAFRLMHPEDRKRIQKWFQNAKEQKRGWKGTVIRWQHKDKSIRLLETIAEPIVDDKGHLIGFTGIDRDVTARKQAEKALKESEEKARALLNAPTDSLLLIDTEGTLLDLNETAARRLDASMEEIIGINIYDILPGNVTKHRKTKAKKVVKSGKPINFEDERAGIIFDNTIYPIFNTQGKVVQLAIYGKSITKLRKAIQALEEREKELKLKAKSLEETNTAMKVLLKKREEDKIEIEENVMTNVKALIAPYFEKIQRTKMDEHQKALMNILESNLNEIVSPFTRKLSLKYLSLTSREITIVNMIKQDYTSKKIAKLMNISPRTVDTHRKNIRRKIGLDKKKANLRSHLLAYEQ